MYSINRIRRSETTHIFCSRDRVPEQAHTLGTDLHRMTENPDGLLLYMSLMWNKSTSLEWEDQRFNDTLDWLHANGFLSEVTATHYKESEARMGMATYYAGPDTRTIEMTPASDMLPAQNLNLNLKKGRTSGKRKRDRNPITRNQH